MTWPTVPLRRLVTCLDGRRIPLNSEQRADMRGDIPYWGAGGVLDFVNQAIFDEPLVLLKEDGSPFFIPEKGVAYYTAGPTWINNHIHALRATDIYARFLAYALNCVDYSHYLTGSTRDKLTQEDLKKIDVWRPPYEEQRRIADFLDVETTRIDKLRTLQRRLTDKLDEREISQLDAAIDDLVGTWGTAPLRRFLRGVDQGASPQAEALPAGPDEWGVLKVSCLRPGRFFPEENKRLPSSLKPDANHEVRSGDLLIIRANTPQLVGSTAVVPETRRRLLLSDKIFRVHLDSRITAEFAATVARGSRIRGLCAATSNGASQSMANIRFEEVKAWPLPVATLDAQHGFVKRVDRQRTALDALRAKVERQAILLTERRQALVTAAVTGQFDVSTASGRNVIDGVAV